MVPPGTPLSMFLPTQTPRNSLPTNAGRTKQMRAVRRQQQRLQHALLVVTRHASSTQPTWPTPKQGSCQMYTGGTGLTHTRILRSTCADAAALLHLEHRAPGTKSNPRPNSNVSCRRLDSRAAQANCPLRNNHARPAAVRPRAHSSHSLAHGCWLKQLTPHTPHPAIYGHVPA